MSFLSPAAWACRAGGARAVYFTDQTSNESVDVRAAVSARKRLAASVLASAYERVFCVSGFVRRQNARRGYVHPERLTTLYNSVDFRRIAMRAVAWPSAGSWRLAKIKYWSRR